MVQMGPLFLRMPVQWGHYVLQPVGGNGRRAGWISRLLMNVCVCLCVWKKREWLNCQALRKCCISLCYLHLDNVLQSWVRGCLLLLGNKMWILVLLLPSKVIENSCVLAAKSWLQTMLKCFQFGNLANFSWMYTFLVLLKYKMLLWQCCKSFVGK